MKIILTGGSGFLGKTILSAMAPNEVVSIARSNCDIKCDLARQIPTLPCASLVIHAAGKAHSVPKTVAEKQEFFEVNVKGTLNLLKGLEQAATLPKSFIFVSSVAVYGKEKGTEIDEDTRLAATDPYGRSKIEAESVIQEWCKKHDVICGILRLPLLAGHNPPGNLGALIKGVKQGYYFNIGGGTAKKSMVLTTDVANILPKLAEVGGIYNLTDGYHPSFYELSRIVAAQLDKKRNLNLPYWAGKLIAVIGDHINKFPLNSNKLEKITSDLTFNDSKARTRLGWAPNNVLEGLKVI